MEREHPLFADALALRLKGRTLNQIAEELGASYSTINRILGRSREGLIIRRRKKIYKRWMTKHGRTFREVAKQYGVSIKRARRKVFREIADEMGVSVKTVERDYDWLLEEGFFAYGDID